jgi:hypothetical protein
MPTFYFHLYSGIEARDDRGLQFPDLAAARDEAIMEARELISEFLYRRGCIRPHHRIDVADESGAIVETVAFAELMSMEHQGCSAALPASV